MAWRTDFQTHEFVFTEKDIKINISAFYIWDLPILIARVLYMSCREIGFIGEDDQHVCMGRNYNSTETPSNSYFEAARQHLDSEAETF